MEIILESKGDVERVAQLISWLNRPAVEHVVVLLPWLEKSERQRLAKALKFLFNDCGCIWGAPAFVITFVWLFSIKFHASGFTWIALGYSFFVGFCVAVAAKLLGLAWSYWRLKVWLRRIMLIKGDVSTTT